MPHMRLCTGHVLAGPESRRCTSARGARAAASCSPIRAVHGKANDDASTSIVRRARRARVRARALPARACRAHTSCRSDLGSPAASGRHSSCAVSARAARTRPTRNLETSFPDPNRASLTCLRVRGMCAGARRVDQRRRETRAARAWCVRELRASRAVCGRAGARRGTAWARAHDARRLGLCRGASACEREVNLMCASMGGGGRDRHGRTRLDA